MLTRAPLRAPECSADRVQLRGLSGSIFPECKLPSSQPEWNRTWYARFKAKQAASPTPVTPVRDALQEATFEFLQKTVIGNKYIPCIPTAPQAVFLALPILEAFYGGAVGGGKSASLLMAALQFVDVPGYAALLLRRTFADLALPGALIPEADKWLRGTDAVYSAPHRRWTFPSGATLNFGYLEGPNDHYRYQSSAFQYIGFDELTQFQEFQYRYLFSRCRRKEGMNVPLRVRSTANPGGVGHAWVKQRFLTEGKATGRVFVPAKLEDNPHIDKKEYERALAKLDPVTRSQLRDGNWDVQPSGGKFKREWFEVVEDFPHDANQVRYWDLAATPKKTSNDPDWTVGCRMAEKDGVYYVVSLLRTRDTPMNVEALIKQTATLDSVHCPIWIEQEGGASGAIVLDHYVRNVLRGFEARAAKVTASKVERANPMSSAAESGNIKLVRGSYITGLLDELSAFPAGAHDDQVDAMSGAFSHLAVLPDAPIEELVTYDDVVSISPF